MYMPYGVMFSDKIQMKMMSWLQHSGMKSKSFLFDITL